MSEPGLQAGDLGSLVELPGDLLADAPLDVGGEAGEQEADRLQGGVQPGAEGQLRASVRRLAAAVAGGGGGGGFAVRAQRVMTRGSDGARCFGGLMCGLFHR